MSLKMIPKARSPKFGEDILKIEQDIADPPYFDKSEKFTGNAYHHGKHFYLYMHSRFSNEIHSVS